MVVKRPLWLCLLPVLLAGCSCPCRIVTKMEEPLRAYGKIVLVSFSSELERRWWEERAKKYEGLARFTSYLERGDGLFRTRLEKLLKKRRGSSERVLQIRVQLEKFTPANAVTQFMTATGDLPMFHAGGLAGKGRITYKVLLFEDDLWMGETRVHHDFNVNADRVFEKAAKQVYRCPKRRRPCMVMDAYDPDLH